MKFAIPTVSGKLCEHFGHCEKFAVLETENNKVVSENMVAPPASHEPGVYPQFLAQLGVEVIIAGGMGQRAIDAFTDNKIKVFSGVNPDFPEKLVVNYLNNQLDGGVNLCDH
ncbi:NifB/NifX family molybdenum-iron cluster-binding protein [Ancylomarina sp. 16SWW S1-10-2]|uniref:NifB/NifX family molybdenum-iron cluster-binding protein n=1 Tax=Ancylomarina sp. 16SWW S1-10-2 TaxID=2499681 RepID=UPI0012ADC626|nr:NifB/NifX family molybdenum-iron cluster-binding protein [Ancylomarina sp. 16SWW S1-10-2]MRT93624.1 ATPase [Ancylomarina sp. 16SWW S1-10-2]